MTGKQKTMTQLGKMKARVEAVTLRIAGKAALSNQLQDSMDFLRSYKSTDNLDRLFLEENKARVDAFMAEVHRIEQAKADQKTAMASV